ncbi:MAG: hypothetical protein R3E91_03290 [Chlamydiales bacterium]
MKERLENAFLQQIFEKVVLNHNFSNPLEELLCSEFIQISRDFQLTKIQDSWSWRNAYTSKKLAVLLIDDQGYLKKDVLNKAIDLIEGNLHSLGPNRYHDSEYFSHLLKMLYLFLKEKEAIHALYQIRTPDHHQGALDLIRVTLSLQNSEKITDVHTRQAALSALLTSLRQNVGSCFATAPAIMIQKEQPLHFLADIAQLFTMSRLVRTYEGHEYAVPLSLNWGLGDLMKPIFLPALGRQPIKTLSLSPGLQMVFEETGLIKKDLARTQKQKAVEKLIGEIGWGDYPFAYFTADHILKHVYLSHYGLKEKEINQLEAKSFQTLVNEVVIDPPSLTKNRSQLYKNFLRDYQKAKNLFTALTDNPLLKSWEFTLASLSESQANFTKWNFYISLGIETTGSNGIGKSLQNYLQEKIEAINHEIENYQSQYDHLYAQIKSYEGRRVSTAMEANWIQANYQLRIKEINRLLAEQEKLHEKGKKLTNVFSMIVEFYGKKIREYFQEVYDPQMHTASDHRYDDSPAGFRLLYKHGRTHTPLWTMIYSANEYLHCLKEFFIATEGELSRLPELEGIEKELSEMITIMIKTINEPDFLNEAFFRLAKAYEEPISPPKRRPWAYVSGGTVETLINSYYCQSDPLIKEEKGWVESENELLAFFIDTFKALPLDIQEIYQKDSSRSMVAYSPTHAFLIKPGWPLLKEAWESPLYTYTWIRDVWSYTHLDFLEKHHLDRKMMEYLVDQLISFIPFDRQWIDKHIFNESMFLMRADQFRRHVMTKLSQERLALSQELLHFIAEELDSLLYLCMPFFTSTLLYEYLQILFKEMQIFDQDIEEVLFKQINEIEVLNYHIFSAHDLREIAKGLILKVFKSTRTPISYDEKIIEAMRILKFAYPEPILIGDTNWVKNRFGFIVSPGTGNVEFWCFDHFGIEGYPLSAWKEYFNGMNRKKWGIYTAPFQYGQFTK